MKNKIVLIIFLILFFQLTLVSQETGTLKDPRDGKVYKTVKIGTQIWMAENLAYKANSGCWAYDNNFDNVKIYGYLYNYVTAKKVCPIGWHLPKDAEWTILTDYLGGEYDAGKKLKEAGTSHWENQNNKTTNESGFTALPGGHYFNEMFFNIGIAGTWWSVDVSDIGGPRDMSSDRSEVMQSSNNKECGFSVRCIKNK